MNEWIPKTHVHTFLCHATHDLQVINFILKNIRCVCALLYIKNTCTVTRGLYRDDPKFSDRYAWANSVDPDQTAQGLHCLPFRLHCLDS